MSTFSLNIGGGLTMSIVTQTIDAPLTADEHVAQINAATANITRASSVSAAARPLVAAEVSSTELDATAARDNLKAMSDITREVVLTKPISGEFPVTAIHRNAAGEIDVEYDNVAII